MNDYDGGPAFPVTVDGFRDLDNHPAPGMSLRDYFAAKAMQGLIASFDKGDFTDKAKWSYRMADAMLKERDK